MTIDWINPAPPLGIRTSIYSFNFIISVATCLLVSSISWTHSFGSPAFSNPLIKTLTISLFEFIASLPPLNITVFPDFKQSPAASQVTFGLASYIIPITPNGTLFCPIWRPFGLCHIEITSPIGSWRPISSLSPSAMPLILSSFNDNLSSIASDMPFALAFSTSISLAFNIDTFSLISSSAINNNASFLAFVDALLSS